ncbi:hypothetical protein [Tumebacillus lipolyticus]|uniref:Uncharacterized protein n=1 Tax=Tumebacillus lipolyticus TaxID=1280370 RepID=A0ABW4ZSB8_9BACL
MPLVLLEDMRKPMPKKSFALIGSVRIFRPLVKIARFAYQRSSALLQRGIERLQRIREERSPEPNSPVERQGL